MDTEKIIKAIGGRKVAMQLTGLTKGRISQLITEGHIPSPWMKFFEAKFPELDWPYLKGEAKPRKGSSVREGRRTTDKQDKKH